MIPELGQVVVEACGIGPGDRVIDIAAGSGNASIPAALAGADVVATDLTPELLDAGTRRRRARRHPAGLARGRRRGAAVRGRRVRRGALVVGVMFAPHHEASADELVRVSARAGRIGLVSWTPEGFIGQMFATMKPYAPAPPPGAQPPPLWGREDHVRALLGDRVTDVSTERRTVTVDQFATGEEFRDYFKAPTGRRSRSTARWPGTRSARPPWTRSSRASPGGTTTAAAPCSGSTCW